MISVKEATDIVLKNVIRRNPVATALENALGKILAEDVESDIDMPPFDRSMMDGYALNAQDAQLVPAKLRVVGEIPAGSFPKFSLEPGQAAKIMTGAPLPEGANAVREFEKAKVSNSGLQVEILEAVKNGQNLVNQASEVAEGDTVLTAGTYIQPAVIGLLATVGKHQAQVFQSPSIAILSTGDELVDPHIKPLQGQIRNSNSYSLQALCMKMGLKPRLLGIAKDDECTLSKKIRVGLQADVLLITGGVSMGDHDFVKDVFHELGLKVLFEKISIKPGKPTVFAKKDNKVVFGLPGNPVSSSTVFDIIVKPALRKMMGFPVYMDAYIQAKITQYFENKSKRENYHPCVTWYEEGEFFCRPLSTKGSGDMVAYSRGNSYLICPIDVNEIHDGMGVTVVLRDDYYLT